MRDLFLNFAKDEGGATLVEYGVALIVAIVVGGVALSNLAEDTDASMDDACGILQPTTGAADGVNWQDTSGENC